MNSSLEGGEYPQLTCLNFSNSIKILRLHYMKDRQTVRNKTTFEHRMRHMTLLNETMSDAKYEHVTVYGLTSEPN